MVVVGLMISITRQISHIRKDTTSKGAQSGDSNTCMCSGVNDTTFAMNSFEHVRFVILILSNSGL